MLPEVGKKVWERVVDEQVFSKLHMMEKWQNYELVFFNRILATSKTWGLRWFLPNLKLQLEDGCTFYFVISKDTQVYFFCFVSINILFEIEIKLNHPSCIKRA
jgi:hypothetical protein